VARRGSPIKTRDDAADRRRPRRDAIAAYQDNHDQNKTDPKRPVTAV